MSAYSSAYFDEEGLGLGLGKEGFLLLPKPMRK